MSFVKPEKTLHDMNIAEGMIVADFDAGAGYYTLALAEKIGPYGKVFAIDVRDDLLTRIANEAKNYHYKNVEVINGNIEKHDGSKLLNQSVDRVVIANTLFACDYPENVIKEASRILKRKGKIAVVDWTDSFNNFGPHPDCIIPKEHIISWFNGNGMMLDKEFSAGDYHYGLLFKFID